MFFRKKYMTYMFIFAIGWFAGTFFATVNLMRSGKRHGVAYNFSSANSQRWLPYLLSSKPPDTLLVNNTTIVNPNGMLSTVARRLPYFPDVFSNETDEEALIILDWPIDDKLFTAENYLALETLLVNHPDSKFRVLLPTSRDAYLNKIGNLFSISQFRKYSKLGYDIEVLPVGQMEQSRGPGHGTDYWLRWMNKCCKSCDTNCRRTDRTQPFHLLMYLRLCRLWRRGGVSSDFSFLILGSLKASYIKQGYFLKSTCNDRDIKEAWQDAQDERSVQGDMQIRPDTHHLLRASVVDAAGVKNTRGDKFKSSRCVTSSLLVFNTPKSEAIDCVLRMYDNASFVACLEHSDDPLSDSAKSSRTESAAPHQDGGDTFGMEGAKCLEQAFAHCFATLQIHNDLTASHPLKTHLSLHSDRSSLNGPVLELFNDQQTQTALMAAETEWSIPPSVRALWMGELAWEGHWRATTGSASSYSTNTGPSQKLSLCETVSRHTRSRLKRIARSDGDRSTCSLSCHTYSLRPYSLAASLIANTESDVAGSQTKKFSYRTGIEESSCAPNVAFVGFMQSAVPVINALLTSHPQALSALGAGVASASSLHRASCYRTHLGNRHILYRPWCFPHIEPVGNGPWSQQDGSTASYRAQFLSVDMDSRYAIDLQAPLIMNADNPNMKIIFVVRNPIERIIAHYMDIVKVFPRLRFDDIVDIAFSRHGKFGIMRNILLNDSNTHDLISWYYSPASHSFAVQEKDAPGGDVSTNNGLTTEAVPANGNTGVSATDGAVGGAEGVLQKELVRIANQLFMQSIYLPSILHYGKVFGNSNIMIVNMDSFNSTFQMSSKRLESIAKKMYAFIGLCPHDLEPSFLNDASKLIGEDPDLEDIPAHMKININTIRRLALFLEPFNAELSRIIGINLTEWSTESSILATHSNVIYIPPAVTINVSAADPVTVESTPRPRKYWFERASAADTPLDAEGIEGTESGGILSAGSAILRALFPPRHSTEKAKDGGFNTTIGMLAMF